jgi:hypothetical protein
VPVGFAAAGNGAARTTSRSRRTGGVRKAPLGAPLVERRRRPDATHATLATAGFLRIEMSPKILQGVRGQPLSKSHAGLRAPPHHSELIDVEVPRPRPATKWRFAILDQALTVAVRFLGHSASKQSFDLRVDGELLG